MATAMQPGQPLSSFEQLTQIGMMPVVEAFPLLKGVDPRTRQLSVAQVAQLQERLHSHPEEEYREAVLAALGPQWWSGEMEDWWQQRTCVKRVFNPGDCVRNLLDGNEEATPPTKRVRSLAQLEKTGREWYGIIERRFPVLRQRLDDEHVRVSARRPSSPVQTRTRKRQRR